MRTLLAWLVAVPLVAAEPVLQKHTVFEAGTGGYKTYRIPGLVVTDKGTLLAYCEARKSDSDWGQIDIVMRRSTDGGKTWAAVQKLVTPGAEFTQNPATTKRKPGEITANNPVAIVDRGVIHFLCCVEYMRCFYTQSTDDGATWARPAEITAAFEGFRKDYAWKVLATGPGHGIRLSKSGRLVVPVWLSTADGGNAHRPSVVATIYSDDAGKTWKAGEFIVKHPDLANPSETAVVELADGRVMANIRHESAPHTRAVSFSADGASGWSKPFHDAVLPEPICMGSLARSGDRLLFSNPHNTDGRERRTVSIHLSDNGGKTWPQRARRAIESGLSGYSDLAVGADEWVYCFYERNGIEGTAIRCQSLVLARFNEAWMTAKPVRIVCIGDSITRGFRPGVRESEAFPARLEEALRRDGIDAEVINVGIGGETTRAGMKRLEAAVINQKPDLVLVMYGANDSFIDKGTTQPRVSREMYRLWLTLMLVQLAQANIKPILMTTNRYGDQHPVDGSGKHPNLKMTEYMEWCREVASELKIPLVDHQQAWIDAAKAGTDIEKWMTDHIHPNAAGHAEMTKAIVPVVKKVLGK